MAQVHCAGPKLNTTKAISITPAINLYLTLATWPRHKHENTRRKHTKQWEKRNRDSYTMKPRPHHTTSRP